MAWSAMRVLGDFFSLYLTNTTFSLSRLLSVIKEQIYIPFAKPLLSKLKRCGTDSECMLST
ncbi:MAG: hypothetical protein IT273_06165 [Chitinophagales bacterium]|nr:hypothetical protein [Chitinophagales bacterium]